MADSKVCKACGEDKPLTAFNKAQPRLDGSPRWQSQCKPCRAKWCKDNSDRMNATARNRRARNPDKQRVKDRATYQRRHEKELERGRRRRADPVYQDKLLEIRINNVDYYREFDIERNKLPERKTQMAKAGKKFWTEKRERAKELSRASYKRNILARRASAAAARVTNRESLNAALRERKKQEWERYYSYAHNRRAKLKGNGGRCYKEDIAKIRECQGDKCAFCKTPLHGRGERDHIVPPCYGGTNDPWNNQLTCSGPSSCNRKKSDTHPIIFMLRVRAGLVILGSPPAKTARKGSKII